MDVTAYASLPLYRLRQSLNSGARSNMAFIQTVEDQRATGKLASIYARFRGPDGKVGNGIKAHSINPEALEAHVGLYQQVMYGYSPLSVDERELVAAVVSKANGDAYCNGVRRHKLARLLPLERRGLVADLAHKEAEELEGLTERERVLVDFVVKLARDADSTGKADIDALRAAGLTDREIFDLVHVTSYVCYSNRMMNALGVEQNDYVREDPALRLDTAGNSGRAE